MSVTFAAARPTHRRLAVKAVLGGALGYVYCILRGPTRLRWGWRPTYVRAYFAGARATNTKEAIFNG